MAVANALVCHNELHSATADPVGSKNSGDARKIVLRAVFYPMRPSIYPRQFLSVILAGVLKEHQQCVIEYLQVENQVLLQLLRDPLLLSLADGSSWTVSGDK